MQTETQFKPNRLAVLIDADNASANLVEALLKEIAKYGSAHVKRIYGDWTNTQLAGWKAKLHKFAIQPIQQFAYTTGKNATDSAMIIDAMDLLYTQNFDGFCIVSSDSDFTKLSSRIRESGLAVYGFGEKKTPIAFVSSCDKFIYTENLDESEGIELEPAKTIPLSTTAKSISSTTTKTSTQNSQNQKITKELLKLLKDAYEVLTEENDWVDLGRLSLQLTQLSPSFHVKNYGYKNLSTLIKASSLFETKAAKDKIPFQIMLKGTQKKTISKEVLQFLQNAYEVLSKENEWIDIGLFGKEIKKLSPSFSSKKYGCRNLSMLVQASGLFEKQNTKIRLKQKK